MVSTTVKRSLGDVPRWNLSNVFPSLDSAELKNAIAKSQADITALETFLDQHHISKTGSTTRTADQFANIINGYLGQANALLRLFYTVGTYISLTVSADSFDTTARRMMSEIEPLSVRLSQIDTRFTGWLGSLQHLLPDVLAQGGLAAQHAFYLQEMAEQSRYMMSEPEEALAADDLCEIMLRCQKDTYSDGLDERYLHQWMWTWKPHYYDRSFYNFPYAFGLLFATGLYAIYQK